MDPNRPGHHSHNPPYLDYDPTHEQQQLHDPNAWSYDYVLNSPVTTNSSYSWPANRLQYVPTLPSNADAIQTSQQRFLQSEYSNPASAPFHAPTPDSYYLSPSAHSPYGYNASPHPSAYPSPISRSMSVSAVSNASIDQANLNQQQAPGQTQGQSSSTFLPTPRQIRFVSTDGQPHAKRRRINAACLTCRKRKTRCSGEKPACKTCSESGHKCAGYAEKPPRKDGDKNNGEGEEEDDNESASSSPRRQRPDSNFASQTEPLRSYNGNQMYEGRQHKLSGSQLKFSVAEALPDPRSPVSNHTVGSGSATVGRTSVPYFRYFGPTAIVPGFKQMVVQMKDGREYPRSHGSLHADTPAVGVQPEGGSIAVRDHSPAPVELPYYDTTDPDPNPSLITGLCETFFVNLGCNYPFLQRERFLKDLAEKRVDAILVYAVCAVSARFSSDPILARSTDDVLPRDDVGNVKRAFRGQPFAQRAMSAVIDTFSCPTLAVTQACLLLAYEEFGSDRDSGLWMYLGTSIRMAQDLGIQKLEGLQLEGRRGPTPKTAKRGEDGKQEEFRRLTQQEQLLKGSTQGNDELSEDRRASERERIDTFWSIFFLDRAVSSGVGRPVTLRDEDIEISFPYRSDEELVDHHPNPFPVMIRIVHMYGRVADVLNNIEDVTHVTPEVMQRLAGMEKDLTGIYQKLSPKLHFNATNFQHYVKVGQGTNFILLHFWFHTLIVLLHQPTLLHSFEGRIQQLFPDSRELSMSSAKTIADILAFAELIDVKSFVGNPFTSQPMYVAACAFLAEVAAHSSQPPSRRHSPFEKQGRSGERIGLSQDNTEMEQKIAAKHSLLASAASQNYQRCYKALQTLNSYWAGCRYILTALDQKSTGLTDPLLFTSEDVDEMPSTQPSFTTPGWRKSSFGVSPGRPVYDKIRRSASRDVLWSPNLDYGNAIGWSITGTANSPAPNLSFLYHNSNNDEQGAAAQLPHISSVSQNSQVDAQIPAQSSKLGFQKMQITQDYNPVSSMLLPRTKNTALPYDPVSTAEADLLLGLHSPSAGSSSTPAAASMNQNVHAQQHDYVQTQSPSVPTHGLSFYPNTEISHFNDMFIESQDIDMSNPSNSQFNNVTFPGGDIIPWLEYLPPDVLNYFGAPGDVNTSSGVNESSPRGGFVMPSGPGPPHEPFDRGPGGRDAPGTQRYSGRRGG